MPQTSTGVASTSINAQCTVPAANDLVTGAGLKTMADSIENDLATIKSGTVTIAGVKTFSGNVHLAQTKSLVADGTGATMTGTWTNNNVDLSTLAPVPTLVTATTTVAPTLNAPLTLFTIPQTLGAAATVSLQTTTTPVPNVGQRMRFFFPLTGGLTLPHSVTFKREGSGANLGQILGGASTMASIEFCFTTADGWIVSNLSCANTDWSPGAETHIYGY